MPYRKVPLVTNEVYHSLNRAVASQCIFNRQADYLRFIGITNYYRFAKPQLSYSHYLELPTELREQYLKVHMQKPVNVEILAFCIMPNHFHFLLKQKIENGISDFMRNLQNSYATYFNKKNNRSGGVFQSMFKAVRVETNSQLVHVSRYIHLNPTSAHLLRIADLAEYEWSSLKNYIQGRKFDFVSTGLVLSLFKSKMDYFKFVLDQADYQRRLQDIKHLMLEK